LASAWYVGDELCFTRNVLVHQAGHCFVWPLGQAVLGTAGCTPGPVTLDPAAAARVALVRDREDRSRCAVDTSRTSLAIPLLEMRKAVTDPPLRSGEESACIGWRAPPLPLRAARRDTAPALAVVQPGETLLFQYEDEGPWTFVEALKDGARVGLGWTRVTWDIDPCADIAG